MKLTVRHCRSIGSPEKLKRDCRYEAILLCVYQSRHVVLCSRRSGEKVYQPKHRSVSSLLSGRCLGRVVARISCHMKPYVVNAQCRASCQALTCVSPGIVARELFTPIGCDPLMSAGSFCGTVSNSCMQSTALPPSIGSPLPALSCCQKHHSSESKHWWGCLALRPCLAGHC